MLYVELLPDAVGEHRLRSDWTQLEEAGLPNLSRHRSASNRPHVTVSLHPDEVAPDGVLPVVALTHATGSLPLPLVPGALAVFGRGPWVLVRTLVVTEALLALHAAVAEVLGASCVEHGRPGRWVPHTTVGHGLDAAQVAQSLSLLGPAGEQEESFGVLQRVRCWDSTRRRVTDLGTTAGVSQPAERNAGAVCRTRCLG